MITNMKYEVYMLQVLFICGITLGSQNFNYNNIQFWMNIVRYVIYQLTIAGFESACGLIYNYIQHQQRPNIVSLVKDAKTYLCIYAASVGLILHFQSSFLVENFQYVLAAYLVVKYPKMGDSKTSINYGVGMACSYFEGYLNLIIPSNGSEFVGFEENIRGFESAQGVFFPVKKLFLVITKSLHCPPNLIQLNKNNRPDLPYLEACKSLEDLVRNVAGVTNRVYRNSAYKIHRPGKPSVYLVVESASPLNTLYKVLRNKTLYDEISEINKEEVVKDFVDTLHTVLDKSRECRGKCEFVYYDDDDPNQNLADILLDKIRELEPNFENLKMQ